MDGPPALDPIPHVPPRELEVLRVMCHPECWLEKEVPKRMGVSLSTFKTHREKVFKKCKVCSRLQLIVKAVCWQLVDCFCSGLHPQGSNTNEPFKWELVGTTTKRRFNADNLEPGVQYWFAVSAVSAAGETSKSEPLLARAA